MGESNQGSLRTSVSPFDVCPGHSDLQMVVSTGDQLTGYTYLRPWGGCPTVRGRSEEIHRFSITSWASVSHVDFRNFNPSHRASKAKTQGR